VVFRLSSDGKLKVLHNFDGANGAYPIGPLVQGNDGNFYGTTSGGGSSSAGIVFKMRPNGDFTVLHDINGDSDGYQPFAGLVWATDGNLYGVNSTGGSVNGGTIFRVSPEGIYSVLYDLDFSTTGGSPLVTMLQHTNGTLYGDTYGGGNPKTECCGMFFGFGVGLKAFVSFLPFSGGVGKTVEFFGQHFKGAKSVSFNGTTASFKVLSDTYLTATVPDSATTGFVTVTTAKGKLKSNKKFIVIQ